MPMPAKQPLTIGFNVPFHEAIAAAKLRGVVLPDVYYGELQGIARQMAFSIAGIASLDQLQAVKDSLYDYMEKGGSFKMWKLQSAQLNLELPAHRLDNIWRTNLQGNYMRGKWEKFQRNADTRPYLLYDAINDSRVRPSHLAHDGTIRPVTDAFWRTHSPPLGYRCRCSLISLTEEQAQARSRPNPDGEGTGLYKTPQLEGGIPAEPDKGWDYNPFDDRMQWVNQALERFDPKLKAAWTTQLNSRMTNWIEEKLPSAKALRLMPGVSDPPPAMLKGADSALLALDVLRSALAVQASGQRIVTTPVGHVVIDDQWLLHIVEKREAARERYANWIIPTLTNPTEVWLADYAVGDRRKRFIKLFADGGKDLLVVVTIRNDEVLWNVIPMPTRSVDNQRNGILLWKGYR